MAKVGRGRGPERGRVREGKDRAEGRRGGERGHRESKMTKPGNGSAIEDLSANGTSSQRSRHFRVGLPTWSSWTSPAL